MRPVDVFSIFGNLQILELTRHSRVQGSRHSNVGSLFVGETKSIERFEESRGSDDCQRTLRPGGEG